MSNNIKKIFAVGLSLTTAVWLSGAAMALPVAQGATVDELQAQIAALLNQIQALQAQLGSATSGGGSASAFVPTITRDLTLGSTGADVKQLQQFLNAQGYTIASSGAGSPGNETEYFGALTKAALGKFQAANGISPTAGYFGSITRAKLSAMASTGGTGGTPGGQIPSGNALSVAIASDSPSARTIGSGTAFNPALKLRLTAGSQAVSITSIKLQKGGFLANTNLNGVDIIDSAGVRHGNVITSVGADNTVLITMATDPIVVAAGQTQTILVRFNLLSGSYTGTVAFGLNAASDITSNAGSVTGTFPISGVAMNIVSGSSALASTTLDVLTSTGSSTLNVDAVSEQEITRFRITESSSNEGVNLHSLSLYNYENAADADYKDVTLYDQAGTALATAQPSNKTVVFNLSTPYFVDKGLTKDFTVKAKIVAGTTRKVNFVVYNDYDIDLRGSSTGVSVIPSANASGNDTAFPIGNGFNIQTIGSGSVTLNRASDSPSSGVTPGSQNVVLAKFIAKPTGEDMELRQIKFALTATSTALTGTVYVKVNNATVYSVAATSIGGGLGTQVTLSSYPILTAGVDSTITVETSIPSTATNSDSYQVFNMDLIQVKRLVTNDLLDPAVQPINGNNIAVSAAKLTVTTLNTPVANSMVAGTNDYELAQIQLNAQAGGEDVRVSKVRITYAGHNTPNTNLGNWRLFKDSETSALTVTGSTASFSSNASGATMDFTFSSPITVSRTTPVTLHVKANVLSGATEDATSTINVASTSAAYTATGATTGNTVEPGASGNTITGDGQAMTVVTAGSLTLSLVSGAGASPSQNQVVTVGSTGQTFFAFKLSSLYETQKITSLKLTASSSANAKLATTTLRNISLYEGTTLRKTAAQFDGCGVDKCWITFTDNDNILSAPVPTTGVTLYVKADVAPGGTAILDNDFRFKIVSSSDDIAIKGSSSGLTTGSKTGTPAASGLTYVVPQRVTIEAVSPAAPVIIGNSAGNSLAVFKVTNNGTAPIYLASSTAATFTNGGSATNSLTFALYASAMSGSQNDTSVTYIATSTADGASSSVPFDLTYVSSANRKIDGGGWRYLTIKNVANGAAFPGVPVDYNTFQLSVSTLGNLLFSVDEADLGYSGNGDTDLSDTIPDITIEGTPSVSTVTVN